LRSISSARIARNERKRVDKPESVREQCLKYHHQGYEAAHAALKAFCRINPAV